MRISSIRLRGFGVYASLVTLAIVGCGGGHPKPVEAPELDAETLARQAESFYSVGRVSDAIDSINAAIEAEPEVAQWHHRRGALLFRAGRLESAEMEFLRALELDPYLTDARNFLGTICTEQQRWDEGEVYFLKALADAAYPTPELVYFNLGLLYSAQGRDQDSLTQLRRAVEINPKYYHAHFELASTLDRLDKLPEAAQEYEVAAPDYRSSGDYFYRLGLVYFRLGEGFKAKEKLRQAIDVSPGSESAARARELLGMIH